MLENIIPHLITLALTLVIIGGVFFFIRHKIQNIFHSPTQDLINKVEKFWKKNPEVDPNAGKKMLEHIMKISMLQQRPHETKYWFLDHMTNKHQQARSDCAQAVETLLERGFYKNDLDRVVEQATRYCFLELDDIKQPEVSAVHLKRGLWILMQTNTKDGKHCAVEILDLEDSKFPQDVKQEVVLKLREKLGMKNPDETDKDPDLNSFELIAEVMGVIASGVD